MEERPNPKLLSCIPCAKRKVRCDRLEPCSHCKRRKADVCEYPSPNGHVGATESEQTLRTQQARIEELEQHILRIGADGSSNHRLLNTPTGLATEVPVKPTSVSDADVLSFNSTSKKRLSTLDDFNQAKRPRIDAGLVEHNMQTVYIEVPVWYSLSEARNPGNESQETFQENGSNPLSQNDLSTGYHNTILDLQNSGPTDQSHRKLPTATQVHALWNKFMSNVHPVVKIFFDWDKAPIIDKAASDATNLSRAEQALCSAIYFTSILSLSHEECRGLLGTSEKSSALDDFQAVVESALLAANYACTNNLLVLQALVLYIVGMRNRAKPATCFSLMGIAIRTAQRLGLHRDGSLLGLSPMQAEEKRRIWWQLQHADISISQVLGSISMTLYAEWDTKMPTNLEDADIYPELKALPPDRPGLTSMSHCLWRYHILYLHRSQRDLRQGPTWITNLPTSTSEKHHLQEYYRRPLAEKFLQHCEPVNPFHVYIQIGINSFLIAVQRGVLQPSIAGGARISEMLLSDRDELLSVCIKAMEYYILAETTPSIAHLRWHNENYFQWTALVYIVIESHHRANQAATAALWTLISKVCELHPRLTTAIECPEVSAIARLILLAWQQREEHLETQQISVDRPWCVGVFEGKLGGGEAVFDEFDFDLIDWTLGEGVDWGRVTGVEDDVES